MREQRGDILLRVVDEAIVFMSAKVLQRGVRERSDHLRERVSLRASDYLCLRMAAQAEHDPIFYARTMGEIYSRYEGPKCAQSSGN
jgi:hypothetical protein